MLIPAARRAWTGRHELELEVLGAVRRPHLERRVEGLARLAARGPRAPPRAAVAAAQQLGAELHDVLVRHGGARARDLPRVPQRVHHVVAAGDDGEAAKDGGVQAGGRGLSARFVSCRRLRRGRPYSPLRKCDRANRTVGILMR